MRMWMLPPACMCMQHILGEHAEIHKHRHVFVKGWSIAGRRGQIEPAAMKARHDWLAQFLRNHASPYVQPGLSAYDLTGFTVSLAVSAADLAARCEACRILIANYEYDYGKF